MILQEVPHTETGKQAESKKNTKVENPIVKVQRKTKANNGNTHGKKKTVGQGHYLSITTLNFNAISSPIKRYRLAEWV